MGSRDCLKNRLTQVSCVGAHGRAPYKPLIKQGVWAHSRAPLHASIKIKRSLATPSKAHGSDWVLPGAGAILAVRAGHRLLLRFLLLASDFFLLAAIPCLLTAVFCLLNSLVRFRLSSVSRLSSPLSCSLLSGPFLSFLFEPQSIKTVP